MIVLDYFTDPDCGVCKVLKPKLFEAVKSNFPFVEIKEHDITIEQEFAAQHMVFTLPVVIIKMDEKEQYRFARSFGVSEVLQKIERLVNLTSS